jgi:DeoR/GlpR family transcriptional regulator of sugar metabolism
VLAETRRREITEALRSNGAVTVAELETRFGVSPMTARRDLDELERRGLVRRTHGGAVLPTTSAHEDSFARRMKVETEAKRRSPRRRWRCSRRARPSSSTRRRRATSWRAS